VIVALSEQISISIYSVRWTKVSHTLCGGALEALEYRELSVELMKTFVGKVCCSNWGGVVAVSLHCESELPIWNHEMNGLRTGDI
jgi:hypothetical protein